jgi:hypothetical protein
MDNYLLEQVGELDGERLSGKTWLVVHKLHRTPYHLGLIHQDKYYALSVKGSEIKTLAEIITQLSDKTYNNLLIEIRLPANPGDTELERVFHAGQLDHRQFRSCLFPIREAIAKATANDQYLQANNLFELLDLLKKDNLAGEKMATRMAPQMESKIVLMRYDQETIRKHIKRLQEINQRETNHQ